MTGPHNPHEPSYPAAPPTAWPGTVAEPRPPSPPPRRGGGAPIIAAALVFAVLVASGLGWALARADDRPPRQAPATTTASTAPGSTSTTPADSSPDSSTTLPADVAVDAALPALIRFVEEQRERAFGRPPEVIELAEADYQARVVGSLAVDAPRRAAAARTYQALGVVEPGTDVVGGLEELAIRGTVAHYDPARQQVWVVAGGLSPYGRSAVVRELTQALDDEVFPVVQVGLFHRVGRDTALGSAALAEGSAGRVEAAYERTFTPEELRSSQDEKDARAAYAVARFPPRLRLLERLPRIAGVRLLRVTAALGGTPAVDRALNAAPGTSEQALDAEIWAREEPAVYQSPLGAPGPVLDSGRFGLADLLLTIGGPDPLSTDNVALGWGGGAYVTWQHGESACTQFRVVGDAAGATSRIRARVEPWARSADALFATMIEPGNGREVVDVVRCA